MWLRGLQLVYKYPHPPLGFLTSFDSSFCKTILSFLEDHSIFFAHLLSFESQDNSSHTILPIATRMSSVDNKSAAPSREIKHYRIHRATSDDKNGLEDVHPLASIATFGKWYHFYVLIFDKIKGEGVGCVRYRFYRKTFDDICPILNSLVGVPKWRKCCTIAGCPSQVC